MIWRVFVISDPIEAFVEISMNDPDDYALRNILMQERLRLTISAKRESRAVRNQGFEATQKHESKFCSGYLKTISTNSQNSSCKTKDKGEEER